MCELVTRWGVFVPVEFLTDAQAATYGCYAGPPSAAELDRCFLLDDKARSLIESKRLPHTRLGYAVQLTTLLFIGRFLADPTDVPTEVVDYLAEQLDIADASCVKDYRVREMTRLEHATQIRDAYGFVEFPTAAEELARWVDDRAWTTGDGPKALFDGAVVWLREHQILLPGVSTLARLVARVRDAALQRLWDTLAGPLTAAQAHALELLLEVPDGARTSDLERLRRGPTRVSGRAMAAALDRVSELSAIGVGQVEIGAVPRRRVVELARYGMAGKAPALRRHPYARRLATLLATVVVLQLSPRIRDLGKITLHRIAGKARAETDYPHVGPLLTRRVNVELIAEHWDDLLRLAGSLKFGHATASLIVGKLSASSRQNALAAALKEYGALRRTIYAARYLSDPTYRRKISRQLNKGESLHALKRDLLYAHEGTVRARQLQARATDDAVELFDVLMTTELLARAQRQTRDEQARRYPRVSRDAGKLAAAVGVMLEATTWGPEITLELVWDAIETVVSRAELRTAVANITDVVPAPGADPDAEWRATLVDRFAVVRPFLPMLCTAIAFGATAEATGVLDALRALPDLLDARPTTRVPAGYLDARKVAVDLVPPGWTRVVFTPGRPEATVHRAGYVFCVLELFHQRLRRRDIFALASGRWADPRAQLLVGSAWEVARGPVLNALQLPTDPDALLAEHARDLDAALRHVAGRLIANTKVSIDDHGRLHAGKIDAVPDPPSLTDLRRRCEAMLPRVDIGEVVLEVMSWQPEFAAAFTPASGGHARLDDLGVSVAAALTAHALNVGFTPVITPGVAALTRHRISHVDQNYLRAETYAAANAPLITAQADIPLAQTWGGGLLAAVDGVRFVVPVRSIDARPNPRYFGRRRGVTLLNLVNDQAVGLAGQVVSGTPRDSLHVIDLIYRQDGGRRPEVIISDTGSYSDMVCGLMRLLGFDYRPQLADLPDAKLWRINTGADYGPLATAARGKIDLGRVRAHWPDLLRLAGSIHTGAVSAHDVLRMLAHGGNPTQLGEALAHYGRIFKTLHVLSYVDQAPYRAQIKGMRNLQEGRHDLARHVFHGRRGDLRRAYHEGMEDQLGALGLVLNCITLWTTEYYGLAVESMRAAGHRVDDEVLAHISPAHSENINFFGAIDVDIEGELAQLDPTGYRPLRVRDTLF